MKPLDLSLIQYQEGTQVPSIVWKVTLRVPDEDAPFDIDITERLMSDPKIIDAAEYRENLTYINEVSPKLNNEDKYLSHENGSGILDTDDAIEIFIDGYFDVSNGQNFLIRKFGGWYDRDRLKNDSVKLSCEAMFYSYFGRGERINGANVSRKYLDENGLRLYTAKLWVRDANIAGYPLKKGLHTVTTFFDTNPKAYLDDGTPVILTFDAETTLSNADDTERVTVYYAGFEHAEERVSTLVVKQEGQYPETYFYYATVSEIVQKCFEVIGVTDFYIQNYTIDTFDGRQIISGSNRVDNTADQFIPVAIEFNGADKYYIAGVFPGTPNKNQIWEYNRTTAAIRMIYETTLNDSTHYKLIYDTDEEVLLAFMDSEEGDDPGFIQRFTITDIGASNTTLLDDGQYDLVNAYYRFHYSHFLKKFIYLGLDGATKTMFELSLEGVENSIDTDANFELNGFSAIYESGSTVIFFYIKDDSGTRKLYKRSYASGWTEEYVIDWFDAGDYENWYGYKFVAEGKLFVTNFTESRFLTISSGTFSSDLNPADILLYSPFENNGKLFVLAKDATDDSQKLASFEANVLSYESDVILPYDIIQTPAQYGFQQICEYISTDLAILSKYPALMLRFADKFTPWVEGEFDTSGMTVRGVLQELANNFLAYVRVDADKKGFFVGRSYSFDDILTLKRDYTKERITERVYNEKYDRVEITNGRTSDRFGADGIDLNIKTLDLQFLPDGFLKDYAKYFLEYYETRRRIIKVKYLPTFYNYENMDKADLTDFGIVGEGRVHKVSPKKIDCEFEIII